MQIVTHRQYDKAYAKLTSKQQLKAKIVVRLFVNDPSNSRLRMHQLSGNYYPQWSLSVGGDLRIHFTKLSDDTIILMTIGTHAQLYG